jgi:hypothetical protein
VVSIINRNAGMQSISPKPSIYSLNHLEHHSSSGSEQSAGTTNDLHSRTSELCGLGGSGCDRGTTGGLDGRSAVVEASCLGGRKAATSGRNGVASTFGDEVGAANAGLVGQVKHEREAAEVGNAGWVKGSIGVDVSV